MTNNRVQNYAKKTFLAIDNRHKSVKKVFPNCIDHISEKTGFFMGTKEVPTISGDFISELETLGYQHHTVDKASHSGRAIDLDLINPLTGRYMTGSSSGTALNVFLGINDLGIGTDGGGSVLAPAISLNLYGMIHPQLGKSELNQVSQKVSTDGIAFTPSLGLITRELSHIEVVIQHFFPENEENDDIITIILDETINAEKEIMNRQKIEITNKNLEGKYIKSREELILDLNQLLNQADVVISKEGPVDLSGFGDTIFGHFTDATKENQNAANKGFIRVANMVGAISLVIPTGNLSEGYVLMAKNTPTAIYNLFTTAKCLMKEEDALVDNYFRDLSKYFDMGI